MAINLLTKTETKVAERLYKSSVTEGLFSKQYSWAGYRTIEVLEVDTYPLSTYDRTLTDGTSGTIGNRFGSVLEVGDTKTSYTCEDEVKYNLGYDHGIESDQASIKTASSIIARQTREIVVPYLDKYRLNKLAAGAGLNAYSISSSSLNSTNILRTLMTAKAALRNNLAPENGQVVYVSETQAIELDLADQVLAVDKIAEKPIVQGTLGKIAGLQVRTVPDTYMPTGLAFLIVSKGAAWAPCKVKTSRIITDPEDYNGHKVQFYMYHDCFVNAVRANTIYAGWTTAQP